ncbi:MAG: hypothetical protein GVY36_16580 [Verrucomicrobia bacterium]|jgi:hypothetical protein|nr:hypothetical protein [Verrucomicrobiota bacterium]
MRFLDWAKSLFSRTAPQGCITAGKTVEASSNQRDPDDPAYQKTFDALQAYWEKVGVVDPDVITYIVNPMFLGAPPWPSGRQAFKIIRTTESLIIASDGLSDPFEEDTNEQRNGFEMEVFIEVKGHQDMAFEDIQSSAAFALIEQTARQIAGWGGITKLLEKVNVASSEIQVSSDAIPEEYLTPDGGVGVIFGMTAKGRPKIVPDTPLSPVRMVPVTALLPSEVREVAKSKAGRNMVAKMLRDAGYRHMSDFGRGSQQ